MRTSLLLIALLSGTAHSSYTFEERGFIESCIGVGSLIPSKVDKANLIQSVYLREQLADGTKPEDIMLSVGVAKGVIIGVTLNSSSSTVTHAIDSWTAYKCESFYDEMKPRYKSN
ncbi:hypothetical protein [Vibrio rotiferianus]|uniref:hypothetical protein n=1 Tax=Vibrio rotiferianus TaxID=190895 RepID=UPI00406A1A04